LVEGQHATVLQLPARAQSEAEPTQRAPRWLDLPANDRCVIVRSAIRWWRFSKCL
jgi:hypothetical protein